MIAQGEDYLKITCTYLFFAVKGDHERNQNIQIATRIAQEC